MLSWCLWCSWNPSIPFYPLPPSVLHSASLAPFYSHWEYGALSCEQSWQSSDVIGHDCWDASRQTPSEGDIPEWTTLFWSTVCLHGWMSVNMREVAITVKLFMWTSCGQLFQLFMWALVKFHSLLLSEFLLLGKNIPDVLSRLYKQENLAPNPGSGRHEIQITLYKVSALLESHSADFYSFRKLKGNINYTNTWSV